MKKKVLITVGIILVVALGIFCYTKMNRGPKIEDYEVLTDYKLIDKTEEPISVTFGRETCHWCNEFKDVMEDVAEEKQVKIYYMEVTDIDEDHNYEIPFKCADKAGQKLLDGFGTPLTLILEKGKVKDCISGYRDEDGFKSVLRNNNIIK